MVLYSLTSLAGEALCRRMRRRGRCLCFCPLGIVTNMHEKELLQFPSTLALPKIPSGVQFWTHGLDLHFPNKRA